MIIDSNNTTNLTKFRTSISNFKKAYVEMADAWNETSREELEDILADVIDEKAMPFFTASFDELGIDNFCDAALFALQPHEVDLNAALNWMDNPIVVADLIKFADSVDENGAWQKDFEMTDSLKRFFKAVFPDVLKRHADILMGRLNVTDESEVYWSRSDTKALKAIFAMAKANA